jgi:hypothetical protein
MILLDQVEANRLPSVGRRYAIQRRTQCCKECKKINRRHFIGGSDARVIMGQNEKALIRLGPKGSKGP